MNIFIDCEWNGFGGEFISMALVSQDGREFYEVIELDPCEPIEEWVAENVMPILNQKPIPLVDFVERFDAFLNQFDSIHIIADWPEDIVHFCESLLLDPGVRIDTPPLTMEIIRVDAESSLPHNALCDARGIRDAFITQ